MSIDTSQSDIDAIMDLAAPVTDGSADTAAPAQSDAEATSTDTATSDTAGAEPPADAADAADAATSALYPNVFKTYKVGSADNAPPEDGSNPEGTLTVSEFAGHLTLTAFMEAQSANRPPSLADIVKDPAIYTSTKAKRHPLPVVLVFPEDSDEQRDAKVYLPVAEATAAYQARPERGNGTSATANGTRRTAEDLIDAGAKKLNELNAIKVRLDRAQAQFDKASGILAKTAKWLRPLLNDTLAPNADGSPATPIADADLDNAVLATFAKRAAELEEAAALEADAAKNSDIADDTTTTPSDSTSPAE